MHFASDPSASSYSLKRFFSSVAKPAASESGTSLSGVSQLGSRWNKQRNERGRKRQPSAASSLAQLSSHDARKAFLLAFTGEVLGLSLIHI